MQRITSKFTTADLLLNESRGHFLQALEFCGIRHNETLVDKLVSMGPIRSYEIGHIRLQCDVLFKNQIWVENFTADGLKAVFRLISAVYDYHIEDRSHVAIHRMVAILNSKRGHGWKMQKETIKYLKNLAAGFFTGETENAAQMYMIMHELINVGRRPCTLEEMYHIYMGYYYLQLEFTTSLLS